MKSGGLSLAVVLALFACKQNEAAEVIAKNRAQVEANAASAKAIAALAESAPPLASDGVTLDAGPVKLSRALDAKASDTAIMEQLEALKGHIPSYKVGAAGHLAWCEKLMGKSMSPSKNVAEASLGACANAKYLLLVRTLESKEPVVQEADRTFTPGFVSGDVLVYNLASKKALGGFRFRAENDATATSRDGRDYSAVKTDLDGNMGRAVQEGITKYLGG